MKIPGIADPLEEIEQHHELVMIPGFALRRREAVPALLGDVALIDPFVEDAVVQLVHRKLELRDEDVLVIARIADQRGAAGRAGQIDAVFGHRQMLAVIDMRAGFGAEPVDAIEIEAGRAHIAQMFDELCTSFA